jgi:perosamine synthetase
MVDSDRVSKTPLFSMASFRGGRSKIRCVMGAGEVQYFTLGRMALAAALKDAGICDDDEVLMPAYHCIVMVDAVLFAGATPVFYRIHPNTNVDLADIEQRITPFTRALVVAHYFGFPQPEIQAIRNLCDARNLVLIEDCAHALLGSGIGGTNFFGSFGDYVIASPYKFLPAVDGGCLISNRRSLRGIALRSAGLRYQLKMVINLCEFAVAHGRLKYFLGVRTLLKWKDRILASTKSSAVSQATKVSDPNTLSLDFEPAFADKRASWSARFIIKCAAWAAIANLRRKNYDRLHAAFSQLGGCTPLFAHLPDGVVPQVYPLLVDEPEIVFAQLKALGVPIIRFGEFLWDYMDRKLCPVSVDLSRRVFQFPCHQDLKEEELAWIIRTVREVIGSVHA